MESLIGNLMSKREFKNGRRTIRVSGYFEINERWIVDKTGLRLKKKKEKD